MLEKVNLPTLQQWRWWTGTSNRKFGFEFSKVIHHDSPYLSRWILYVGWGTLRLHKFWRGDDDRAPHTHPWWFITIPFRTYVEHVFKNGVEVQQFREVKAFRPHFRPANYEHIVKWAVQHVVERDIGFDYWKPDRRPFYTLVISGNKSNNWGFYPEPGKFTPWRDFMANYESKQ